jgi:hypothetical protein
MCSSIREFGFKIPVLARSDGTVVDGHLSRVSFTDPEGVTHSVVVSAATVYEAAALAVAEFRRAHLADPSSDQERACGSPSSPRRPRTRSPSRS